MRLQGMVGGTEKQGGVGPWPARRRFPAPRATHAGAGWRGFEKDEVIGGFGHTPCHTCLPLSITHLSLGGSEP